MITYLPAGLFQESLRHQPGSTASFTEWLKSESRNLLRDSSLVPVSSPKRGIVGFGLDNA